MRLLLSTPCCIKKAKLSAANLILFDKLTHVYRGTLASNLCPKSMQQPACWAGIIYCLWYGGGQKTAGESQRVFAIIGDGEMHEGQIWETLQQAGHMKMDNLVAIIDYNGFSSHDPVNQVVNLEPLADKVRLFGWHVLELHNGNDMHQVADTLMLSRHLKGKPVAIIAHTTKGSGVSYMENNGDWHSKTPTTEQYQQAMEELQ